ncbi:uncharacterized protein [Montipora capricornis]|uniref:uncharacterized protein n=1 Tax=Montipora capricornis TaxID=246305 RepID=UPI0035F1FE42
MAFRSTHSPIKQSLLNTLHKPHVNSVLNQDPSTSPLNRSNPPNIHRSSEVAIKKEVTTPVKQSRAASGRMESDDDDDDVPLAVRAIAKHSAVKVKSESVQSALNSTIEEKTKSLKPDKHDKAKNGKPVKQEKKENKKEEGTKKEKKEKKSEGANIAKKPIIDGDEDDDMSLVSVLLWPLINF